MHCIASSLLKKLRSQIDSDFAETKISKDKIRDCRKWTYFLWVLTLQIISFGFVTNWIIEQNNDQEMKNNRVSFSEEPIKGKSIGPWWGY